MKHKKDDLKLNLLILGVTALMALSCLAGFHLGRKKDASPVLPTQTTAPPVLEREQRRLVLTVQVDYDAGIDAVTLPGREDVVNICNLSLAQIDLPEGRIPLQAALESGMVSPEELIAWARLDAKAGLCKETYSSENGFAQFLYRYPNVEVAVCDDVFEAPDGQNYPIRDLTIRDPGGKTTGVILWRKGEDGLMQELSREEWGLSFTVTRADENGVTLSCVQDGGQLIGQPAVRSYDVSKLYYEGADKIPVSWDEADSSQWLPIQRNGTTELCLEWDTPLPGGEYVLHLFVRDVYGPEQMHPLMRNFEDMQIFSVQFTVP